MPDYRGDKGIHECVYAFRPHMGGFSAAEVILPAYLLNEKPLLMEGCLPMDSFIEIKSDHVIIETVKPMEENGKGFILRLYEAEGASDTVQLKCNIPVKSIAETNMLEEVKLSYGEVQQTELTFRPFEIKTLKIVY